MIESSDGLFQCALPTCLTRLMKTKTDVCQLQVWCAHKHHVFFFFFSSRYCPSTSQYYYMYHLAIGTTIGSHQNKHKKSGKAQTEERKKNQTTTTLLSFEPWCAVGIENKTMTTHMEIFFFEWCVSISYSLLN